MQSVTKKSGFFAKKRNVFIMCAVVLVLVVGAFALLESTDTINILHIDDNDIPMGGAEFNPEFEDEQVLNTAATDQPGIKIPGYSKIIVPAGETNVSVDFFNPEENNVYFQLSLVLVDGRETIYESKLIKPGQHLYEIELLRPISAGEYDMTIVYSTFSMDEEYSPRNGADVACVLVAE